MSDIASTKVEYKQALFWPGLAQEGLSGEAARGSAACA